jgi:uncharacterized membrane protein
METATISSTAGILAILSATCALFFWAEKRTQWRFFQFAPPLVFIYLVPILLTTFGILPGKSPVYSTAKTLLLPMLIVLMLVKMNVRGAVRILGRGLGVMLVGSLGVMIGAPVGMLAVRHWLEPDAWKAFGALSASWVGGTANLVAVSQMTDAGGLESLAILMDSVIAYLIWLPILLASKRYAAGFARFTGANTKRMHEMEEAAIEHDDVRRGPSTIDYMILFSAALLVTWIGEFGGNFIDSALRSAVAAASPEMNLPFDANTWRILIVTTLGICLSFTPLSRIPGSLELAMALLYLFVACMGATADLNKSAEQAVPFFFGALIMILIHGVFCVLGAKIFKTDIHTAAIASAANIGGVATSTIVATHHERSLIPAAVLMAIIGIAIGTYCGYATALICRAVM